MSSSTTPLAMNAAEFSAFRRSLPQWSEDQLGFLLPSRPQIDDRTSPSDRARILAMRRTINQAIDKQLPARLRGRGWGDTADEDPFLRLQELERASKKRPLAEASSAPMPTAKRAYPVSTASPSISHSAQPTASTPPNPYSSPASTATTHGEAVWTPPASKPGETKPLQCFLCGDVRHATVKCGAETKVRGGVILGRYVKVGRDRPFVEMLENGVKVCVSWLWNGKCGPKTCTFEHKPCTLCGSPYHHPGVCAYGVWNTHGHPSPFLPLIPHSAPVSLPSSAPNPSNPALSPSTAQLHPSAPLDKSPASAVPLQRKVGKDDSWGSFEWDAEAMAALDELDPAPKPAPTTYLRFRPTPPSRNAPSSHAGTRLVGRGLPDHPLPLGSPTPNLSLMIDPTSSRLHHPHPAPAQPPANSCRQYPGPASCLTPAPQYRGYIHASNLFLRPDGTSVGVSPAMQAEILSLLSKPQRAITLDEYKAAKLRSERREQQRVEKLLRKEDELGRAGDKRRQREQGRGPEEDEDVEGWPGSKKEEKYVTSEHIALTRRIPFRTQDPDGVPELARIITAAHYPSAHPEATPVAVSAHSTRILSTAGLSSPGLNQVPDYAFWNNLPIKFLADSGKARYAPINPKRWGPAVPQEIKELAATLYLEDWKRIVQSGTRTILSLGVENRTTMSKLVKSCESKGWRTVRWKWEFGCPDFWEAGVETDLHTFILQHVLQNIGVENQSLRDLRVAPFDTILQKAGGAAIDPRRIIVSLDLIFCRKSQDTSFLIIDSPHPEVAARKQNRGSQQSSAVLDISIRLAADILLHRFSRPITHLPPPSWSALACYGSGNTVMEIDPSIFSPDSGVFKVWKGFEKRARFVSMVKRNQDFLGVYYPLLCYPTFLQGLVGQVEKCQAGDEGAVPWHYVEGDFVSMLGFYGSRRWVDWNTLEYADDEFWVE